MFSYENLEIWQLSIAYAKNIYRITNKFPKSEQYGLSIQLRRAAVSISANIAEGSGSIGLKDKLNFLDIAVKSALETTSELQIALELSYINKLTRDNLYNHAEVIIKRIRAFKKFLQNHKP